jgi:hypothetical protein
MYGAVVKNAVDELVVDLADCAREVKVRGAGTRQVVE